MHQTMAKWCLLGLLAVAGAAGQQQVKPEARDMPFSEAKRFSFDTIADDLLQCNPRSNSIFSEAPGVGECLRRRAVTQLLGLSASATNVDVSDSLSFEAPSGGPGSRALPPLYSAFGGEVPTLADAARHFLGQRMLRWQLDALYPGLVMRVGPVGADPDLGLIEFVLERLYDETDRAISPAKLLMKRTVLPTLLGLKLKLSTLTPLLLAGFFFVASKAAFFSKLAILIGATIGLKTLLFSGVGGHTGGHYGAYGLHPVGHSVDGGPHHHHPQSAWDTWSWNLAAATAANNPYGPVSFKSADLDDGQGPREAEARQAPAASPTARPPPPPPPPKQTAAGARNFAWETRKGGKAAPN